MRAQGEGVEAAGLAQLVEGVEVSVGVEGIVTVGRVVLQIPLLGRLHVLRRPPLGLALVIHHVKPNHLHDNMSFIYGFLLLPSESTC